MSFVPADTVYADPLQLLRDVYEAAFEDRFLELEPDNVAEELRERHGVFVTLVKNGSLRGCIGTFRPLHRNAGRELVWSGLQAAFNDPRFSPLRSDELPALEAVVDVLDTPEKSDHLDVSLQALDAMDPPVYLEAVWGTTSVVVAPPLGLASVHTEWASVQEAGATSAQPDTAHRLSSDDLHDGCLDHSALLDRVAARLGIAKTQKPSIWVAPFRRYSGRLLGYPEVADRRDG